MPSNYKKLGNYIRLINNRNKDLIAIPLLGVSIRKVFMPSIANIIGTDMSTYKLISKNQFAYGPVTSRNGDKISIALLEEYESAMVSQAYTVFEIIDQKELLAEYLMMWFRRPEFDRYARFKSHGSAREIFDWTEMLEIELPIPSIEKQKEIVREYHIIQNRISLNNQLVTKLEETAQAIYKRWFVDFEFPDENGRPYKSSGGKMFWCDELNKEIPKGWKKGFLADIATIIMGQSPSGENYNTEGNGDIFYQGRTEFGFRFPNVKQYTTETKRKAKKGDILISVRAPVGDLNIANNDCAIGRGISAIRSKIKCNSFLFYLMQEVRNQFDAANDEGTIFGSITKDGLNDIIVLITNEEVIKSFENKVAIIDKNIEIYSLQHNSLKNLNSLLLSKMTKVEAELIS
ncbi:restriction endonuclease subunit S [Flavobacterium sp. C3NV]|uniref:restriction endonuclease subunit S n=1 Tax=Flavobacterium sp. C3NV TaxID=3393358 RepID=UPI00398FFE2C